MIIILLSAIILTCLFAPIGCILLWQRKAYFADGLAHACLLASSLSIGLNLPIMITAPITAIFFVFLLFLTKNHKNNAAINLVSSLMLSSGVLIASTFPNRVNLNNLLLGDILSISNYDLITFTILLILSSLILWRKFSEIILFSLNPDLASVYGINIRKLEILMLIIVAVVLSVSMKIIGALLAASMLILPGFTAQTIAKNPKQMIFYSIIIASLASIIGIIWSFYCDIPTGPAMMLCYGIMHFIVAYIVTQILSHRTAST